MSLLSRLHAWLKPPKVESASAFADYLGAEAAHVTQTSIIGYCHARTLLPFSELTREQLFRDAYQAARWHVYAEVLADLIVFSEGILRPAAGGRESELARRLAALYSDAIAAAPGADGVVAQSPESLAEARRTLADRLAQALLTPSPDMAKIAARSASLMFEMMPIHPSMKNPDRESIMAGVSFKMAGVAGRLRERLDAPAIVAGLLAATQGGQSLLATDDGDTLHRTTRGTR